MLEIMCEDQPQAKSCPILHYSSNKSIFCTFWTFRFMLLAAFSIYTAQLLTLCCSRNYQSETARSA
jgi:hypothetical protein